ncbi:hypothetical protein [Caballeronia sp. 15711]|uniref:hypothetical protein n=1 Tax=Caballeronia sp. 15711 TaxID=3391029 RepID=UPI0039E67A27
MQLEPLHVTNRVVAVVAPTAPFVEWINAADPSPPDVKIALGVARDDPTAFLIPTDNTDDPINTGNRWIQRNWKVIFEHMLEEWYVDADLWPRNRTIKMFRERCEVSIHSTVLDCANKPIEYED